MSLLQSRFLQSPHKATSSRHVLRSFIEHSIKKVIFCLELICMERKNVEVGGGSYSRDQISHTLPQQIWLDAPFKSINENKSGANKLPGLNSRGGTMHN